MIPILASKIHSSLPRSTKTFQKRRTFRSATTKCISVYHALILLIFKGKKKKLEKTYIPIENKEEFLRIQLR